MSRPPSLTGVLYGLGLAALLAVALSLGGGETEPVRWALVVVPVALFASASLAARRAGSGSAAAHGEPVVRPAPEDPLGAALEPAGPNL